jgi:tyrosine-specific transport protein
MGLFGHNHKFWYAVAVIVGSMVGVGIFGLPFAFAKAGFWLGIGLLVVIGAETLLIDSMYGEVVLRTHAKHQLTGYAKKYLGRGFQRVVFFAAVLTGYAALLAYIIIAGDFLNTLLSSFFFIPLPAYSIIFFAFVSLAVLAGLKTVSWLETIFTGFFITIIVLFFAGDISHINPINFQGHMTSNAYLPYGVLLFAFGGLLAIPISRELLVGQERKFRRAITTGLLIVSLLYALFVVAVVGVSGGATSQDAISGLFEFVGPRISLLGAAFGITAVSTSFMMLASGLVEVFHFDFRIRSLKAWLLVVVPPLLFFLAGLRTFVDIISLAGGVALGIEHLVIVLLYAKVKKHGDRIPEYSLGIPNWLLYIIMAVLATGIVYYLVMR